MNTRLVNEVESPDLGGLQLRVVAYASEIGEEFEAVLTLPPLDMLGGVRIPVLLGGTYLDETEARALYGLAARLDRMAETIREFARWAEEGGE